MTDWKKVQGSQTDRPLEFDTDTSEVTVYQRRNIERVEVEDKTSGQVTEMWQYDERQMSREEYAVFVAGMQQAQIDEMSATIDEHGNVIDEIIVAMLEG